MAAKKPPAVRVAAKINIDKLLNQLAKDTVIGKSVQNLVFEKTRDNFQASYEKAYRDLVNQIINHLQKGFPGATKSSPNVFIKVENPFGGADSGFAADGWLPFTQSYREAKFRAFSNANKPFVKGKALEDKLRRQKKSIVKNKYKAAENNTDKFWVFRRNLANAALTSSELNANKATVTMLRSAVKKRGVLVSGKNKATIRYSVGLTFGKFSQPFDDMVRKPFMTGMKEKSRVWDTSPGSSMKKGVRVIAYVEAKRPFIVDLSASVGRLVRQRLKIK